MAKTDARFLPLTHAQQVGFFAALDKQITACGKRWGVFAFGEDLNEEMWTQGLGQSGYLFDSTCAYESVEDRQPQLTQSNTTHTHTVKRTHMRTHAVAHTVAHTRTHTHVLVDDLKCSDSMLPPFGCQPCQSVESCCISHLSLKGRLP